METKNNNKGITLIALVITIIVLLILAGVSIAMITGQNGILTKANEAKTKTEQAEIAEKRKLTQAEAAMNFEETNHTETIDGNEITVKIPAYCAVSQVEGENTLDKGLVIIDKNGNEWVWIEVPESVTKSATTDTDIETAITGLKESDAYLFDESKGSNFMGGGNQLPPESDPNKMSYEEFAAAYGKGLIK